ncbi:hypothetical protein EDP1_4128 [Pseudomonas putida S610]|nr:hypothetical protein EDP1_4128 [Pseudomonas putida S610]
MPARTQAEGTAMPVHQVVHRQVLDHYPFGLTGRARGVDHIGQVPRGEGFDGRVVVPGRPVGLVQQQHRPFASTDPWQQRPLGEDRHRGAVFEQVAHPLVRVGGIDRHVACACLEHCQQAHQRFQAAPGQHRHAVVRLHPKGDQVMRQGIGLAVELAVAQLPFAKGRRHLIGAMPGALLDTLVQRMLLVIIGVGGIEGVQQPLTLGGRQHGQVEHRRLRRLQ